VIARPRAGIVIERPVFAHLDVVIGDDLVDLKQQVHEWRTRLHVTNANEGRADVRVPDLVWRAPGKNAGGIELA
jgi:hypothetical protein